VWDYHRKINLLKNIFKKYIAVKYFVTPYNIEKKAHKVEALASFYRLLVIYHKQSQWLDLFLRKAINFSNGLRLMENLEDYVDRGHQERLIFYIYRYISSY
jgi:hypothetical protein